MKYLRQLTYKEKKTYLVHSFEGLALAGLPFDCITSWHGEQWQEGMLRANK
jgi:hypothetical protein